MQREPIQFGAMSASRSTRSASGGVSLGHSTRLSFPNSSSSTVLDEVFATYSRVDAGSSTNKSSVTSGPADMRTTRELVADISTQLKALDSQRRQLARLLETVSSDETV